MVPFLREEIRSSVAKSQWHLPCLKRPHFEEWLLILFHISDHSFDAAFYWPWWATLSCAPGSLTQKFTRKERTVLLSGTHPEPVQGKVTVFSEYFCTQKSFSKPRLGDWDKEDALANEHMRWWSVHGEVPSGIDALIGGTAQITWSYGEPEILERCSVGRR